MRFVIFLLFISMQLPGQDNPVLSSILKTEPLLREQFISLNSQIGDREKDSINVSIIENFSSILTSPESFFYTWPELDMIGKIKSDDMLVNIFTWNIQKSNNEFVYYGILQYRIPEKKKEDKITIFRLNDVSGSLKNPENIILSAEKWYGSLYYSITTFTHRKKTWYALLGFDFHNNFSNKKILDILHFNQNTPVFGEVIDTGEGQVNRLLFEYSSDVVMALRYDPNLQSVVFDHLVPLEPIFKGFYRFYVPDGSYNALDFTNGMFSIRENIDARNY